MKRGKYELKKRAERQEETRLRIARATLELHEILGPALTTRSTIAERAGVTRPTVYSHFPDDLTLGKACSSLEMSDNPLPDPEPWQEIADPEQRMRGALGELYAYFRRRERLWTNILRDQDMPLTNDDPEAQEADAEIMEPIFLHWERMKETLAAGWGKSEESPGLLLSAIGLALDFQTWRAMARTQGLSDEKAIELMVGMVRCAAGLAGPG
ncbi:MAG TPA: TetR/AcrR family transcriptional regulator [Rubrobacteraceae bacterium]|nr:TetR/AcrR family transcriptional regulator [Rubrobacteraceae bacterium]